MVMGLAQATPALGRRREIDLAGILDRQHMPARRRKPGLLAPAGKQRFQSHLLVSQKAAIPDDLRTMAMRCPPPARTGARNHSLEKRRPPLSRRRSPNRPNQYCSFNMTAPQSNQSAADRITVPHHPGILIHHGESFRRTEMCASTSAQAGRRGEDERPKPACPETRAGRSPWRHRRQVNPWHHRAPR